jgi:putative DNA primase/helicase
MSSGRNQSTLDALLFDIRDRGEEALLDPDNAARFREIDVTNGHGDKGRSRRLIARRADEITPQPVTWLWPGRLAIGKQTSVAGDPGTGKTQLAIYATAAVTTGGEWPCGEGRAPLGSVIILCAEDGDDDTIVPRLMAAGADLSKVHLVSAVVDEKGRRGFNLQADLDLLERKIDEVMDAKLISIDPVSAYLGKKVDSYNNSDIRGVLEPFGEMAQRKRVAVLSITHFSKGGAGASPKALHRFIGSIAFVAAARMAYVVIEDQEDQSGLGLRRRLFLHAKNNLAAPAQGLAFRLEQRLVGEHKDIVASSLFWEREPVLTTADQALGAGGSDEPTATDDCVDFLKAVLVDGPANARNVEREARDAGLLGVEQEISQSKPFRKARKALGVVSEKLGMDKGWVWRLPKMPSEAEDAPPK